MDFSENDFFLIKEFKGLYPGKNSKLVEFETACSTKCSRDTFSDQCATFTRSQSDPISFFSPKISKFPIGLRIFRALKNCSSYEKEFKRLYDIKSH